MTAEVVHLLVALLIARLQRWEDAEVPMGKWIRCRIEQLQVCSSFKSVETPTPHDHVEFQISQHATLLFFLPTTTNCRTHNPLCLLELISSSSLFCLCCTYTYPPFSPRFQFVHSFVCLRSCLPYLHPSSSPGIPEHLPSSMYSVSAWFHPP